MRCAAALALALSTGLAVADDEAGDPVPANVMAVYQEGKTAYDKKQYGQALQSFDRCIDLEPARARWHYNRGLALKKLRRDAEALQAFLDAKRIDPTYKQSEISSKITELRYTSSDPKDFADEGRDHPVLGLLICGSLLAAVVALAVLAVKLFRKKPEQATGASPPPDPADPRVTNAAAAMTTLAARQAPLEHALAPDDDPQGRALVESVGKNLQTARVMLQYNGPIEIAESEIARASAGIDAATAHFESTKGPGWNQVRGERVGCFFCARPLAAKSARKGVDMTTGSGRFAVVACEPCTQKATTGGRLTVRMVGAGSRLLHWGQLDSFDPYQHGYWGGVPSQDVEPWKADLSNERLTGLASLLGAAAVGATIVGFLDLESLREARIAAEAAAAAANNATRSRSTRSDNWRDHS